MSWNKVIDDYYYQLYLVLPYLVYTVYAYRAKYSNYYLQWPALVAGYRYAVRVL